MTYPRPAPPSGADAERAAFLRDLRALRDQAGLRPHELAARAHFPEDTLTSAEAGPALPSLPVLQAYVRGCGAASGSADWEDRWRRLTQEPDVETALPTRAPTASRAPAGPFGVPVGRASANPAEQAAIGFGLARVAAGLSPAGAAGTSSWFSRDDVERPESASAPSPSYPSAPAAPAASAPPAPVPAAPAPPMPDSPTTWRLEARETWSPDRQTDPARQAGADRQASPARQAGADRQTGPDRQAGPALPWGQAAQAPPSAPAGFSQAPPTGPSPAGPSGFSPVPGPPPEFSPTRPPSGLPPSTPPSGFTRALPIDALPQRGGTGAARAGNTGTQPAIRDDRPPAQKATGPLHSSEAAPAPGRRAARKLMPAIMIVLAVALVAVLLWLALAS